MAGIVLSFEALQYVASIFIPEMSSRELKLSE